MKINRAHTPFFPSNATCTRIDTQLALYILLDPLKAARFYHVYLGVITQIARAIKKSTRANGLLIA